MTDFEQPPSGDKRVAPPGDKRVAPPGDKDEQRAAFLRYGGA